MRKYTWADIPVEILSPTMTRQMIHGDSVTVARLWMKQGHVVPWHQHVNEQVTNIESGALRFLFKDRDEVVVSAGESLVIASNVPHSAIAESECVSQDIFIPVREDWRDG